MISQVNAETVSIFSDKSVSTSYLQSVRHESKTEKYCPIQPAAIGAALANKGFLLSSSNSGHARKVENINHQRTINRYRSNDNLEIDGLHLEIVHISSHLGRADVFQLGIFRIICQNGLVVGSVFENVKVRHIISHTETLENQIAALLSQREKLVAVIKKMQKTELGLEQVKLLAEKMQHTRLASIGNIVKTNVDEMMRVYRPEDTKTDLFTVFNVLQENAVRGNLSYSIATKDKKGNEVTRHRTARPLKESSLRSVELNSQFFDAALEMMAA